MRVFHVPQDPEEGALATEALKWSAAPEQCVITSDGACGGLLKPLLSTRVQSISLTNRLPRSPSLPKRPCIWARPPALADNTG